MKKQIVIFLVLVIAAFAWAAPIDYGDQIKFTSGQPPQIRIGEGKAIDIQVTFDGNVEDFYMGIDDSTDDFIVGLGGTMATTPSITISDTGSSVPSITLTGQLMSAQVHTVSDTLTVSDCGKVHFLSHASTAIILVLPAPTAGCELQFVTALAFGDQHEVRTPSAANIIYGTLHVNAADIVCTVEDSIEFADTAETVGDNVTIISDGTSWFIVDSIGDTASSIACTT